MEITEIKTMVENGMKAFEALKTDVLPLKKKFEDMDGESKGQFTKLEKAIGDAIEASQKEAGARKALEDEQKAQKEAFESKQKALETELTDIKTAFNRQSITGGEDKEKEAKAELKKLFNQFTRSPRSQQEDFSEFMQKSGAPDEVKALSVGSDPDGGYLTMPEFGGIISTKVFESSPIRQLASVVTISSDTYEFVLDNGEADAEWVSETSSGTTETTPKLGKKSIAVHELAAKPKVTQKLLDDGIIDVESWLGNKVADIFSRKEATAFVSGNGVGKPRGILTYTAGTDIAAGQIEQIASGSATAYTYDGLVNLQNSLKEDYQTNAVFLIKRATNAHLMLIKDGIGHPVFNMLFDKNVGLRPTIMGQPVYFGNDMPAVTANALGIAYGDFKRAYQIVDRSGIRVLRDPYTAKPFVMLYTTKRVGGEVVNYEAIKLGKVSAA